MSSPTSDSACADFGPIDHAYHQLFEGQSRLALCWAGAALDRDPEAAVALLLVGQSLLGLGHGDAAVLALETSAGRAADSGQLPLAISACQELGAHGVDAAALLDELADAYAEGSPHLAKHGATPPRLPGTLPPIDPWPETTTDEQLLSRARRAVEQAADALRRDRARPRRPLPRQGLLSMLDRAGLRGMLEVFELAVAPAGGTIIEQGTAGAEAFIVARGEVEVSRQPQDAEEAPPLILARLGAGALFGEMALLSGAPRAAMVTASRPTLLLVARKQALDHLVEQQPQVGAAFAKFCHRRMVENLMRTSPLLGAIAAEERPRIIGRFATRTFREGQSLITQGEEPEGLHLIASGEVVVMHRQDEQATVIAELGVGDIVGEVSLVLRRPAGADVVAMLPTVTLHLAREQFLELIHQHPRLLEQLYSLAVHRDQETHTIVARPSTELEDVVLV